MTQMKQNNKKIKVYFDTYGCSTNLADSLYMEKLLEDKGYEISGYEEAEIVVVNSCTVKKKAETKFFRALRKAKKDHKLPIAAGCVVDAQPDLVDDKRLEGISILGTRDLDKIAECIKESIKGKRMIFLSRKPKNPHLIHYKRLNNAIAIIPTAEGCLGNCAYCKTKHARGNLESYPEKDILCQINTFLKEGIKEIWLTSQDLASYGLDKEGNILSLLRKIDTLKGDFWVRLGMSNPQHLMPISEELPRLILKSKHFFRFLHIPLQSGSNRILRIMGRKYTREEYLKLIKRIRAIIPDFTLSTDIITGFPGEEQGNFKETLDVIKQIQPDILNISRYWARPNTMAAKMKQLKPEIAIERAKEARKAFNNLVLKKNKGWIGWQGKAIIDEKGRKESLKGRNLWYKQLIFAKKEVEKHHLKIGERVRIKVVRGSNFNLFSKVIQKKS